MNVASPATLCNARCMSIVRSAPRTGIPQWTLADRLGKSMHTADITVAQMADYFGVHRNTVGGWINGRIKPDTRTVRLWALSTGVPYEWLRDGDDNGPGSAPTPTRTEDLRINSWADCPLVSDRPLLAAVA